MTERQSRFLRRIRQERPMLVDGGLATQLEAQGCNIDDTLWSAALLLSQPEEIVTAHKAFIDAGAECIATVSYQASREGFATRGLSAAEADALMLSSVALAKRARDDTGGEVLIAASLGPYGAMLHDGSEYRGDYGVRPSVLHDFHAPRLALFDASDVDVLALETIPSRDEAEVLAALLYDCETPAWVSFSCRDGETISDGTSVAELARLFADHPTVCAVGVNCTAPQFVVELLGRMRRAAPDLVLLAYPNSGETYNAEDGSWSGTVTPLDCARAASAWIAAGAAVVGGCCRMGPEHIRAMGEYLR